MFENLPFVFIHAKYLNIKRVIWREKKFTCISNGFISTYLVDWVRITRTDKFENGIDCYRF